MKSGLTIVKDNYKKVMNTIFKLPTKDVLVGIPADKGQRKGGDLSNAVLGYIHENGAPEVNIPARPFLLPGVRDACEQITKLFKTGGQAALKGDEEGMNKALHAAGLVAMSSVQRRITNGPFLPLKPSTLRARQRRGRTGTKPLIDTGQLRRSITYVVRDK